MLASRCAADTMSECPKDASDPPAARNTTMHFADLPEKQLLPSAKGPWYKELNRYQWFVFTVAALGWLFDTMDQQLFNLSRTPAIANLLHASPSDEKVKIWSGVATMIFMIGWATGGIIFGVVGDRIGRARTMVLTILLYSMF